MPIKMPALKLETPAEDIPFGRGFYQVEEEVLYLPVEYYWPPKRFYSYLDSEAVSLHLDRNGRLIFIEVAVPRRRWQVLDEFTTPDLVWPGKVKFADFRQTITEPNIFCDCTRRKLLIMFENAQADHNNIYIAENLIGQVAGGGYLTAIWAIDIIDDFAGRKIAAWRQSIRKAAIPAPRIS